MSFTTALLLTLAGAAEGDDFFEQRVRPILSAKCVECHGDSEPEGGLRLTSRSHLLSGGKHGAAFHQPEPSLSLLLQAINYRGDIKMPPDKKLRDDEIATLTKWIELGAPWPEVKSTGVRKAGSGVSDGDRRHWAFAPVTRPSLPPVRNTSWPQTGVDRFILSKLEAAGLSPSPPADPRTLLRRVQFTLTGLPPSYSEIAAFAENPSPAVYAAHVDRLLNSSAYGERWARHWLDVARFADTKDGVLMYGDDRIRPFAYTYRDYVVRAFNEDLPFDRFIHEQLAADLIEPKVEPWRVAALGFLTLGRMYCNNQHDVIDDQIDTVTRGFLGLTVSCARCHDHKYDPIPTADYYSLYGVFASCETSLEPPLIEPAATPEAVEFEKQVAAKRAEIAKFLDEQYDLLSKAARDRVGDYLVHIATKPADPMETAIYFLSLAPDDLRPPLVARWRRLVQQRGTSDDPVFGPWSELVPIPTVKHSGDEPLSAEYARHATTVLQRWAQKPRGIERGQINPLVLEALTGCGAGNAAGIARAYGDLLQSSRLAPQEGDFDAAQQLVALVSGRDSPAYFPKSQTRQFMSRQPKDMFGGKLQELDRMAVKSPHAPPRAMAVMDSATPFEPKIFIRGNASLPGAPVPRQFLEVLSPQERQPFSTGSGRLELARAIASPANPLTARVLVNRVWMHHFGEPLVATPSDFGFRSSPPTHPELLDYLAAEFMSHGWSLKWLHREIALSATFQQSNAGPDAEPARGVGTASAAVAGSNSPSEVDPDNRLLWRMHRRRLDWEAMRDTLLAISGRLTTRGPGRPVDIVSHPEATVRTIYGLVDRQSLPNVFRAFDFAAPDQSVERRPRTMVPQQALFAMNSAFMREQAKSLAVLPEVVGHADPIARVAALFRRALGRSPTPDELQAAVEFVLSPPDPDSQLSPWEQLAQVLLSSNELMYLD